MVKRDYWNDEEIAKLKYLFVEKGLSINEISKELNRSSGSIKYMLQRKNIKKGNIRFNENIINRIIKEINNFKDDNEISLIINEEFNINSSGKDVMNYLQRKFGTSSKRKLLKRLREGKE